MSELDAAVELLERSLAYTSGTLGDLGPDGPADLLRRRTPCAGWDLGGLLAHMEDSLDAFTEAASGYVAVGPLPARDQRPAELAELVLTDVVGVLRDKACTLLGAWTAPRPVGPTAGIRIGDIAVAGPVLVATAALEITVHGWDVGRTTGLGAPVPSELAEALLDVATAVLWPGDRAGRFAAPLPVSPGADPQERLLAFLGRAARERRGQRVA